MQDVTVVSCLYGDVFGQFVQRWEEAVAALDPAPAATVLAVNENLGSWRYPQSFHLNFAAELVQTEWIWFLDIDDLAFPDALEGLDKVDAEVWQLGYLRSDGEEYIPPQLTAAEVLAADRNPFVAGSCVRTEAFRRVGGFRDIALQDWGLWRALAAAGATFQSSGRAHFRYMRHPNTRGEVELGIQSRPDHMREMESALA